MAIKRDFDDDDSRIIILNEVDESPISNAIYTLFSLANKSIKSPIHIIINTFGGQIYDMLALYDAIKYVQSLGVTVNTVGLGKIMSAGVILLAAGNNRKIGKNATIMWHVGHSEFGGDILELENEILEFKRIEELCNKILSSDTNISDEKMNEMLHPRVDVYITPEEAIQFGIVDEYLSSYSNVELPEKSPKKPKKKTK